MLINSVVKNEAIRNEQMIAEYEKRIAALPKGSLICRKKEYYYLKYRKDGKVCDEYIGKDPVVVSQIKEQLELRKHYEKMLLALRQEQKAITKIMEGLARSYITEALILWISRKSERAMCTWILA